MTFTNKNELRIRCFLAGLLILTVFAACNQVNRDAEVASYDADNFKIFKGVNLAHWLSQNFHTEPGVWDYITRADIQYLAELGFDHVRLPIDEKNMWDEDGNRIPETFEAMHNCIAWCMEHGMRVVVDLHIIRSHHFIADDNPLWTDPKEQEKFVALWLDLSSALHGYPLSIVAYELLNEPVAEDHHDWNALVNTTISALRKLEPERTIVVGSNSWQKPETFPYLKVPEGDKNIILSFHLYDPFLLTHYKAHWTFLRDYTGPVRYPGELINREEFNSLSQEDQILVEQYLKVYNKDSLDRLLQIPLQVSRETGLPLYCGEFGAIGLAPRPDRLAWYRDVVSLFHQYGIAHANWSYKDKDFFGLQTLDGDVDDDLVRVILKTDEFQY